MLVKVESNYRKEFERRIAWLSKPRPPFLTSYQLTEWTVTDDNPEYFSALIEEIGTGTSTYPPKLDPSLELKQLLLALQHIVTEGFPLPDSFLITYSSLTNSILLSQWASLSWLTQSRPEPVSLAQLIPSRLQSILPADFSKFSCVRDLIALLPHASFSLSSNASITRFNHTMKSFPDLARALKHESHSISPAERLGVYKAFLPGHVSFETDFPEVDSCFLDRFCKIATGGTLCPNSPEGRILALRFRNRSVDLEVLTNSDFILPELLKLDSPLYAKLKSLNFAGVKDLAESIFACSLNDQQLTKLWDLLLVSSPRMLSFVIMFLLVEVRSAILDSWTAEELRDVVLSGSQLVDNFPSILEMATIEDEKEPF